MRLLFHHIRLAQIAQLAAICLAACTHEDVFDAASNGYVGPAVEGESYFTLTLNLPAESTRALPTGGEDGDGREDGTSVENEIMDVWVYILRHASGMDAPEGTPLLYTGFFNKDNAEEWTNLSDGVQVKFIVRDYLPEEGDRMIAVCNAGASLPKPASLGELRNQTAYSAWNRADGTRFVMSSAYNDPDEGKIFVTSKAGTKDDPFLGELNIQRTAARIDLMYDRASNLSSSGEELIYKVYADPDDPSSTLLGQMRLRHVIPVNLMQQSSYMIKRVTSSDDITSLLMYGAREATRADGTPTNYVVEPHTMAKMGSVTDADLDSWYGSTRVDAVHANPASYLSSTGIAAYASTETAKPGLGTFTHIRTLAYTNENTQDKGHHSPDFITGLLLRAVYQPMKVYTDKDCTTEYSPMSDYATGHDFWRYSPTKKTMKEADCIYFSNQEAAEAYKAEHPTDMAEITKFADGICYYNVWLRHANVDSDPHLTFPMEYGIVRNNIYRVGVSKVTGPGTPLPSKDGPEHIYLRIFVREWNLRTQPPIRL